jgi:hypothetical protein
MFDAISGELEISATSLSSRSMTDTTVNASSFKPKSSVFTYHPEFPNLPDKSPMTFLKTMNACLCEDPSARPSFTDILVLLEDLEREVKSGEYLNQVGCYQVCTLTRCR